MASTHDRLVSKLLQYPAAGLLAALLLVGVGAWGIKDVVIQADYVYFFDQDDPNLLAYQALEEAYSRDDSILFVVSARNGDVLDRGVLRALQELTEEAWQIPYVRRVDSLTNFLHVRASGDDLDISPMFGNLDTLSDDQLENRKSAALSEPALLDWLLSPDGRVTAVNASILLPGESANENISAVNYARELTATFKGRYPDLDFRLTGIAMINHGFYEGVLNDMIVLMPIMSLVMVLVLYAALRSVGGVAAVLLLMTCTVVVGVGIATLVGIPITPPSASAAIVIMTVAIADAIHVVARAMTLLDTGSQKLQAIQQSMSENARPILLTSLTTLVGFLCLNSSDVPPYRHLGNTAAIGVLAAYALTYLMLPALLRLLPLKGRKITTEGETFGHRLGRFSVARSAILLRICLVLTIIVLPLAFLNTINDGFVSYFAEDAQIRLDSEYTMDNLTGLYSVQYSLDSGASGGINEPAYLRSVEAFADWARGQPEVLHVSSILPIVKSVNESLHPEDAAAYRLPATREEVAQYLFLYELSLPPGMELTNQIDMDRRYTRVIVFIRNVDNNVIKDFERRAQEWMAAHLDSGMQASGTGPIMMFADIFERGTISTLKGLAVAVVIIALIVGFALGSFRLGLVSLVPNVLPAMMALGLWAILDGTINVAVSSVVAISFGVVVDDTIHILSKYRQGVAAGLAQSEAMVHAFTRTARALITTTVVLCLGFSVLAFSDFGLNRTMGLLTSLTLVIALLLDCLLLPSLVLKMEKPHVIEN